MEKKLEIPVRQTQEDHQEGRESSSSSSMEKRKLITEVGRPVVDQSDDQEDHGEGDQSSLSMKIKKLKVDQPQENSPSMENKKLEVDRVRPLDHHQPQYPKGFRFLPTDVELLRDYLTKKFHNEDVPVPINEIQEVEVNEHSPAELAERYQMPNQKETYVFTKRKSKGNGFHKSAAGSGKWRAYRKDILDQEGNTLRVLTSLEFWENKDDPESKTKWRMKEYALIESGVNKRLDGFVMCKIYETKKKAVENDEELEPPKP